MSAEYDVQPKRDGAPAERWGRDRGSVRVLLLVTGPVSESSAGCCLPAVQRGPNRCAHVGDYATEPRPWQRGRGSARFCGRWPHCQRRWLTTRPESQPKPPLSAFARAGIDRLRIGALLLNAAVTAVDAHACRTGTPARLPRRSLHDSFLRAPFTKRRSGRGALILGRFSCIHGMGCGLNPSGDRAVESPSGKRRSKRGRRTLAVAS